jgi:hypothetical protein
MQFPSMKSNPKYTLRVPSFDGGINTSLLPQNIRDNQAVSMTNMWFKDGALQTRPSFYRYTQPYNITINSADEKLRDLDVDVKIGYQKYDKDNNASEEITQLNYKLNYAKNSLMLYDGNYIPVDITYQKALYKNCFEKGKITDIFFYPGAFKNKRIDTSNGYLQVYYTEVRGYVTIQTKGISGLEELNGRRIKLFFYLVPTLNGESAKASFEVFNSFKDIPFEYQPYQPETLKNFGTSYAELLEDLNVMYSSFKGTNDIYKDITQLETVEYGASPNKGLGNGAPEYGNQNRWSAYMADVSILGNYVLDSFVVYGTFSIRQFQTVNWTQEKINSYGQYAGYETIVPGVYIKTKYENEEYVGLTSVVAQASKIVFTRRENEPTKFKAVYYDNEGNSYTPDSIKDANGNVLPYLCAGETSADITDGKLRIFFSDKFESYKTVVVGHDGENIIYREVPCHLSDTYVSQIEYTILISDYNIDTESWEQQNQSDLITKNKIKIWYGGTNSGYAGGTRLFVAGHPEFGNVLRWSGVNDSSYFLENNFTYIGRDDEKITALNKQDGYLVVFKEHETFAIEYTYTTDSKNNAIVYFPVIPISPYIGCDCPKTIQLISNRLTWLSSEGKVYTLYSENSYSERNIREISQHVENDLKRFSTSELQNAKSADYDNKYFIFIGKTAYIWDYDRNPYYNYTSSEQAQNKLCWYKWDLPHNIENVYVDNNTLCIVFAENANGKDISYATFMLDELENQDGGINSDNKIPITTEFKSKLFNFGKPYAFKNVDRAFFELGNVIKKEKPLKEYHAGDIKIRFYTSNKEDEIPTIITNRFTGTDYNTYSVRPHMKRVSDIGFCIESNCPLKLLSTEISAELYGEVK